MGFPNLCWRPCASSFLIFFLVCSCAKEQEPPVSLEYQRLAGNEDWETLAETAKRNYQNRPGPLSANYFHLAQARRGRLVDELFCIRQAGVENVLYLSGGLGVYSPEAAHILFAMGNMAGAQCVASNSLYSPGGDIKMPMLKILAQVELMRGSGKVAEKYLKILRRDKEFRAWAENASRNPELKRGGKVWIGGGEFITPQPLDDISRIVAADLSDSMSMQYALSILLLDKNSNLLYQFIDYYFGSPALKRLPTPAQEALVLLEYNYRVTGEGLPIDHEFCLSHGVEEETYIRFLRFVEALERNDRLALLQYKNTFWDYMAFSQI